MVSRRPGAGSADFSFGILCGRNAQRAFQGGQPFHQVHAVGRFEAGENLLLEGQHLGRQAAEGGPAGLGEGEMFDAAI